MILVVLYLAAGYWATGRTIYANSVMVGTGSAIFGRRLGMGLLFGWILIPIALIRVIFHI